MNLEISAAYDPISLIYTVTVGKNSVEISGHTLTQKHIEELAKMLEGINDDTLAKATLNVWAAAINKSISYGAIDTSGNLMLGDSDSATYDGNVKTIAIDASKVAAQSGMTLTAIQVPRSASSRLKDVLAAWKDTRTLLSPYDYDDAPKVYYQPRYPSKPPMVIIEEALELLNSKKHLGIGNVELSKVDKSTIRLTLSSAAAAEIPEYKRVLSVHIDYKAFDRTYEMETDRDAGLTARLDTDTYIKLRIAFLINQALKRVPPIALCTDLGVFKVIGSFDKPIATV